MTPKSADSTDTRSDYSTEPRCIAFEGHRLIASGPLPEVALAVKEVHDRSQDPRQARPILIFDKVTSQPVEFDLRGTPEDVARRIAPAASKGGEAGADEPPRRRGRGRPKLGVVGREVTLLPRHWDWLAGQPGGASVTLRKLVDQARRASTAKDRQRRAQDSTYRFLSALAGNLPAFEEAIRALFADDSGRFAEHTESWPVDVRDHARHLAATAFGSAARD